MKQKPNMKFWGLWNLSFGFFGVQIAYALQSANISRIFATLGADPHSLSFFWILPPLMGIIVQPLVGKYSDKTWCRWGRRIPYLFLGAAVAVAVMCLLPNAGSLHFDNTTLIWGTMTAVMLFGLVMLMLLDTSINMAMQPFKMLVGDMVNEEQKKTAYSIQSFLCNAGSVMGYVFPFLFTWIGISNTAPEGVVPDSVIWSFYIGAAILILCVIYTTMKVKEWNPEEYNEYNGIEATPETDKADEPGMLTLLMKAPSAFWSIGLVQFFCWAAFLFMWTYTNGTVAANAFDTPIINGQLDVKSDAYQIAGNWVGILFAVQALGSVAWATIIPRIKSTKMGYMLSLVLGGIGFISMGFITDQYLLFVSFILIGCGWAAMLAYPFALLTNALEGKGHMGTYLGLFNGTICLPQIVAALLGGVILKVLPLAENGASNQPMMMVIAGILLFAGAASVFAIKAK
ncbi:MAG: MFS transporter [Prevotella sp.]|nr:SLC45 family MFS transporter [Prevotella sp.]MCI6402948.1 MFS transporter [Prevotella sp.]MCI6447124.1 MFS transporter [Prevotella sp.]MCI7496779.1 MFS transporter [Prevotella sp.]MDD7128916.1 MFS transporter [Prevotella sp.]